MREAATANEVEPAVRVTLGSVRAYGREALERSGLPPEGAAIVTEVQLEAIVAAIDATQPELVVIDSIQTTYTDTLASAPGSVAQVRECAAQLTRLAKQRGVIVLFVGHVTKEGAIAGPRVLEHIVDTVLYFEGDPHSTFRLVRAIKTGPPVTVTASKGHKGPSGSATVT